MSILNTDIQDKLIQVQDHYTVECICSVWVYDDVGCSPFKDVDRWSAESPYTIRAAMEHRIERAIGEACIDKIWRYQRFAFIKKQLRTLLRSEYNITYECKSRSAIVGYWNQWDKIDVTVLYRNEQIARVRLVRNCNSYDITNGDPF